MKKFRLIPIILAFAILLSGAASAAPTEEEAADAEKTSVVVAHSTKVNGMFFSRQFGNNTSDIDVRAMIHGYNPIVWETQLDHDPDPMVVKSMEKKDSPLGTEYVFTLYDDLKWNDGSPITASDYVFGFALQLSPEFEEISGDTDIWQHIVGYESYVAGRTKELSGVRLLGEYEYSVTVKNNYLPYFYENSFLYMMPSPISVIAPGCEVRDDGKGVYIADKDKDTDEIFTAELLTETILDPETGYLSHPSLTCGPYTLVSYDPESGTVKFEKNEYFKGNYKGYKPTIDEVTLVYVLPEDMPEKLKNGEIDIINKAVKGETIDGCKEVCAEAEATYGDYPRLGYGFIGVACEKGPQKSQAVRQAIAYSFDTDKFVNGYLGQYGTPVYAYYGIGQWMTMAAMGTLKFEDITEVQEAKLKTLTLDKLNHYDIDLDKALDLLVKDGWTRNADGRAFDPDNDTVRYKYMGGKLVPLSFTFGLTIDNVAAAAVLKQLQENFVPLGAEIIVCEDTYNNILIDYLRENGERKYDLSFLAYNFNSIFDPYIEMYGKWDGTGTQNAAGLYDATLVNLCWTLHKTPRGDLLDWLERWIAFEERYNQLLPSIPLYSDMYYDFYPKALKNYHPEGEANWPRALLEATLTESADK
ncbi:MAG: ABC transporter substrate-binding protein [Oscillospiraceae bacterium]|nr:ABC transporter substrate-binding protein [Oscillospiraceae bacterium]